MAAQAVDLLKGLDERVRMLVLGGVGVDDLTFGAVNLNAGGSGGGEELGGRRGEGEDVAGVGVGDGMRLEILFRLRGS